MPDDVSEFLDSGANCVIPKPFRIEHLKAILNLLEERGPICEPNVKLSLMTMPNQKCVLQVFDYGKV